MVRMNRRKYIQVAGLSTTVGLAGCSGSGGGGGSGGTVGDSGSGGSTDYKTEVKAATLIDAVNSDYVTTSIESLKENIEAETNGEITVQTFPAGQIGSKETGIMKKVQQGTIEFGDTSVQNFTPVAPSFDVKNLPYFAGKNQEFVNLVTSDAWTKHVESQAHDRGFEIFSYGFNDPRCFAPGNKWDGKQPPMTPSQIRKADITQRTGGSKFTNTAFKMIGANPTPVGWGEAPTAMQQGTVNAMYNAPQYHANAGFAELLSHEVVINAVHDGRVWGMSYEWFQSLPTEIQKQVKTAGEKTTRGNAKQVDKFRKNAVQLLRENNVQFHVMEGDQLEQWKDAIAYDRNDEWNDLMSQVFPSEKAKKELKAATQEQSDIKISELAEFL